MVRTGREYLIGLDDDRHVQIGSEVVKNVSAHPAFGGAARSIAAIYDLIHGSSGDLTYEEDGQRQSAIWLRPRSAADVAMRRRVHNAIADRTFGLIGRSPDHVAGFISGMACLPEVADRYGDDFGKNLVAYWRYVRDNDLYVSYAVAPPSRARSAEVMRPLGRSSAAAPPQRSAALRVVSESDSGLTVRGTKILATGAVLADELFVGNLLPLAPGEEDYAITFAVPMAQRGLKLLPRRSYATQYLDRRDGPLSSQFDETDAVVYMDDVFVPWERVFCHRRLDTALALFHETPAHILGNAQAHSRLASKMRLGLGLIKRASDLIGTSGIAAVSQELNGLAVSVSVVESLILAEDAVPFEWPGGYLSQNVQALYAATAWTAEMVPGYLQTIRYLLGSQPFQQASDASVFGDADSLELLEAALGADSPTSVENRYRLMSMVWDLVGSEYASRHLQYEMFYAGAQHVTRARLGHIFDWNRVDSDAARALSLAGSPDERRV